MVQWWCYGPDWIAFHWYLEEGIIDEELFMFILRAAAQSRGKPGHGYCMATELERALLPGTPTIWISYTFFSVFEGTGTAN